MKKHGKIVSALALFMVFAAGCSSSAAEFSQQNSAEELVQDERIQAEEALETMRGLYGENVRLLREEASYFVFSQSLDKPVKGAFSFYAKQNDGDAFLVDNYYDELYRYTGNAYFEKDGRTSEWEETGEDAGKRYVPVFYVYGRNDNEFRIFCERVCDYVEFCREVEPFGNQPRFLSHFLIAYGNEKRDFQPSKLIGDYDRVEFYNELYTFADEFVLSERQAETVSGNEEFSEELESLGQDVIDYYLSIEPSCTFMAEDGMEYRMIEMDRALGSSYYSLIGTYDQGETCAFLNKDPYNGSGGEAKWLTFISEKVGFSCLAYSGGSYGSFYRTEDGGRSFQLIEYPSPKAFLPDGEYYNPFVMPEKVYEEDGKLFLVASQGPDGDYYSEQNGHCSGLYVSEDSGRIWEYVGEVADSAQLLNKYGKESGK